MAHVVLDKHASERGFGLTAKLLALTPVVEVLVILVDKVCRVIGVLIEGLHHVPREELAIGLLDAPVQLAHQLPGLGAVEEVHLHVRRYAYNRSTRLALETGTSVTTVRDIDLSTCS